MSDLHLGNPIQVQKIERKIWQITEKLIHLGNLFDGRIMKKARDYPKKFCQEILTLGLTFEDFENFLSILSSQNN